MRLSIAAAVLSFFVSVPFLCAQDCAIYHNCPPPANPKSNAVPKRIASAEHSPPRDSKMIVGNLEKVLHGDAQAMFPDIEEKPKDNWALYPKAAALLKLSNFKRNPLLQSDRLGIVLSGWDVVSLMDEDKAVGGELAFAVLWDGGIWLMSDKENRAAFLKIQSVIYRPMEAAAFSA